MRRKASVFTAVPKGDNIKAIGIEMRHKTAYKPIYAVRYGNRDRPGCVDGVVVVVGDSVAM